MGWLRTLLSWAKAPTADQPGSVTFSHDISTPRPIDEVIHRMMGGSSPRAGRPEALSVPAVLRGRNLLCSIATLPLVTRGPDRTEVPTPFLEQIDPDVPNVVTMSQTIEDLVFEALAWWRVTERYANGWPAHAIHVDATAVSLNPPRGYPIQTLPSGFQPGGVVWIDGKPVPGRDMIRFDSPNPGLLTLGRTIRRAVVLEQAATMYARDPRMLDYFTPTEGADPVDDDEIADILDDWEKARRDRATGYVPAALKYNTVEAPSPADLQLVELQRQVTIEIANAIGVDPEDLGVSTTSRTYKNEVDRRRGRINDVHAPYMRAITDRLSMNDVTKRGHRVMFDLGDYLKADPATRWSNHEIALRNRVVSVEEVREVEELPAIPIEPIRSNVTNREDRTVSASALPANVSFTAPESSATVSFEMDEATAAFRVNREKRTISGLLVPWGKVARSAGSRWRFHRDSLRWGDESRIKLNRDHNRREAVAVATRLQNTPTGLDGSFRVARGEEGDRVLSLAEDGVLDGFSVEVDFTDEDQASRDDDGVVNVHRGTLRGVAITPSPAFDDARVTSVAASTEGRTAMKCSKCNQEHAPNVACQTTTGEPPAATGADSASFTAATETMTASFTSAVEALTAVADKLGQAAEQPGVVDPTKRTAQFGVNEEPLYRFDGIGGEHDFSSDLIAGSKGDGEALDRVEQWIKAHFSFTNVAPHAAEFAVTQGNVGALNPDRQRPDLYVDQLEYVTPIWDSIRKGTIPDNTPFVLPKFSSASGLVADHTENVEPTPGSFTATSQTITPSPVSGKVEIVREAWDQGGNPQLSVILWRQIVRAYFEALEQAAADMLDTLTLTEITLSAAAVDSALASEVKQALAALHFVRGGNRFRDFKIAEDLYTTIADAKDADGRPLFPILNPSNADGRTDAFFGAIAIGGLAGIPAWALPNTVEGTPDVPSKSYLYNREDVSGWASNPQRLEFQYQIKTVEVGVWGYKALASTRTDGVRRINYDVSAA